MEIFSGKFYQKWSANSIPVSIIGRPLPQSPQVPQEPLLTQEIFIFGEFGEEVQKLKNMSTISVVSTLSMGCSRCLKCHQFKSLLYLQTEPSIAIFSDSMKDIYTETSTFQDIPAITQDKHRIWLSSPISLKLCKPTPSKWPLSVWDSISLTIWAVFTGSWMMFGPLVHGLQSTITEPTRQPTTESDRSINSSWFTLCTILRLEII